jgi:hypothetical protein
MAVSIIAPSFAGGELSPNMAGRVDLAKYHVGCELARNFFIDYRGGVSFRPGTKFIAECHTDVEDGVRLIPFVFNQEQSYVLEFVEDAIHVWFEETLVTSVVTSYAKEHLFELIFVQSADVMTITHPSYPVGKLSRTSLSTFTFANEYIGPTIEDPINLVATALVGGSFIYSYVVTAINKRGEESLPSAGYAVASAPLDPTHATPKTIALTWTPTVDAVSYNIYKFGPIPDTQPMPSVYGFIGETKTAQFTDINIAPDFTRLPPDYYDPFQPGQVTAIDVVTGGTGYEPFTSITIVGDGAGASAYAVADQNGIITGVVIKTSGANYTIATGSVAGTGSGATFDITIDENNYYPACVSYFQQRRAFAGSIAAPTLIEFSQVGAYTNFDFSPSVLDADAISIGLSAREVNTVKHLVPMSTGLVVFTTGSAYLITGGGPSDPITPSNISVLPQASTGSGGLPPILVNYNILFQQAKGSIVRDMTFNFETQSYYGIDRSMLANHLFYGFRLTDWAFSEEPHKLLWCVRNDGKALTMTYVPDQEVYGWARHDTNGLFKSVCTIPEGDVNAIYFVVRRYVEGEWRNYLERLMNEPFDCLQDTWYLDCALAYYGTPGETEITISGIEGEVLIDGIATGGPAYLMEAKENLSPSLKAIVDAEIIAGPEVTGIRMSQWQPGISYDRVRGLIIYSACVIPDLSDTTPINTTGHRLWSGVAGRDDGVAVDQGNYWNFHILTLDVNTEVVTSRDVYDSTSLVPNGIGGSDGTARRMSEADYFTAEIVKVVDPRTGNVLSHHTSGGARSCLIYEFRLSENYLQTISPYVPSGNRHLEIFGINDDWYLIGDLGKNTANRFTMELLPRLRTSDEVAADYLLSYASFQFPVGTEDYFFRTILDAEGSLYLYGSTAFAARDYKLWKLTMPTSAPFGGPVVGGGWTNITPWAAGTGPNTDAAGYRGGIAQNSEVLALRIADDELALVTKFYPGTVYPTPTTDPLDLQFDCTYVDLTGATFDHHSGFVTGYMTEDWVSTAVAADAAWAVQDCYQLDTDVEYNSYSFAADEFNYTTRRIYFVVRPVIAGVVTPPYDDDPPDNGTHIVMVKYAFASGSAPVVVEVNSLPALDEQLWDDEYPAYAAAIGNTNVVYRSLQVDILSNQTVYDSGIWVESQNAWWWSGQRSNLWKLDAAFTDRDGYLGGVGLGMPFLKISLGTSPMPPGTVILVNCGALTVTGTSGDSLTATVTVPFTGILADDPEVTVVPIPAFAWTYSTPASSITMAHLIGKTVGLVGDGVVYPESVVPPDGVVEVDPPAAWIVCGLPYQGQFRTMRLDAGDPTVQGRRKVIQAVTGRVALAAGLKYGTDENFTTMYQSKEAGGFITVGDPVTLYTGDLRINVDATWERAGYITVQQDFPMPATLVALIPEVLVGDTQR